MTLKHTLSIAALCGLALGAGARADTVIGENVILDSSGVAGNSNDRMCIGDNCVDGEVFSGNFPKLRLKDESVSLELDDVGHSSWQLIINPNSSTNQGFYIGEIGQPALTSSPFVLRAGAPANALYVDTAGKVGVGTSLPLTDLHVIGSSQAELRLESTGPVSNWDVGGNSSWLYIEDNAATTIPFKVGAGAPSDALVVIPSGNVGFGTDNPNAPLELSGSDTFNFFRITATGATTNDSADVVFTEGPLGTGEFRYNIVDGDGPEMRLNANGDVTLTGTLTTTGPGCAAGCDRVFDADYDLRSIKEHAALMWDNGYLPAVGPTVPGAPVNMTDKMGDMLNELEHAHIYIAELHQRLETQTAKHRARIAAQEARATTQAALNTALLARLDALEAMMGGY